MPVSSPVLTLITDSSRFSGASFFASVEAALQGGVDALLVREKAMDSARLLAFASRLRELTHRYQARLIIHTQADIAAAVGADGVHLASHDMQAIADIRSWLNDQEMSLSVSCHNLQELKEAEAAGADYLFLSPLFPTASHPGAPHLGVDLFQSLAKQCSLPVAALGGITAENCTAIRADGYAVIEAILASAEPEKMARTIAQSRS